MQTLPLSFKPLLWSYDFDQIDPAKDSDLIIRQAINFGTLEQLAWIKQSYGEDKIREILTQTTATTFRPSALRLASILFNASNLSYASRGTARKK